MKTRCFIIIMAIFAMVAISETNSTPNDFLITKIKPIPFMLQYDGEDKITVQFGRRGFILSESTTNEMTFKRGEETIKVKKGHPLRYSEYEVTILDKRDGNHYVIQTGHDASIGSKTFVIRQMNLEEESCTLMDVNSKEVRTVRSQKAQRSSAP